MPTKKFHDSGYTSYRGLQELLPSSPGRDKLAKVSISESPPSTPPDEDEQSCCVQTDATNSSGFTPNTSFASTYQPHLIAGKAALTTHKTTTDYEAAFADAPTPTFSAPKGLYGSKNSSSSEVDQVPDLTPLTRRKIVISPAAAAGIPLSDLRMKKALMVVATNLNHHENYASFSNDAYSKQKKLLRLSIENVFTRPYVDYALECPLIHFEPMYYALTLAALRMHAHTLRHISNSTPDMTALTASFPVHAKGEAPGLDYGNIESLDQRLPDDGELITFGRLLRICQEAWDILGDPRILCDLRNAVSGYRSEDFDNIRDWVISMYEQHNEADAEAYIRTLIAPEILDQGDETDDDDSTAQAVDSLSSQVQNFDLEAYSGGEESFQFEFETDNSDNDSLDFPPLRGPLAEQEDINDQQEPSLPQVSDHVTCDDTMESQQEQKLHDYHLQVAQTTNDISNGVAPQVNHKVFHGVKSKPSSGNAIPILAAATSPNTITPHFPYPPHQGFSKMRFVAAGGNARLEDRPEVPWGETTSAFTNNPAESNLGYAAFFSGIRNLDYSNMQTGSATNAGTPATPALSALFAIPATTAGTAAATAARSSGPSFPAPMHRTVSATDKPVKPTLRKKPSRFTQSVRNLFQRGQSHKKEKSQVEEQEEEE